MTHDLATITQAQRMPELMSSLDRRLARAETLPEITHCAKAYSALAECLKKAGYETRAVNKAKVGELNSHRKAGRKLIELKERGVLQNHRPKKAFHDGRVILKDLELNDKLSHRYQLVAMVPEAEKGESE